MIILISLFLSVILLCEIILVKYCQVKKRALFIFSFLVAILVILSLMITGDITVAYAWE